MAGPGRANRDLTARRGGVDVVAERLEDERVLARADPAERVEVADGLRLVGVRCNGGRERQAPVGAAGGGRVVAGGTAGADSASARCARDPGSHDQRTMHHPDWLRVLSREMCPTYSRRSGCSRSQDLLA